MQVAGVSCNLPTDLLQIVFEYGERGAEGNQDQDVEEKRVSNHLRARLEKNYCTNVRKSEANHNRILNLALKHCRRLAAAAEEAKGAQIGWNEARANRLPTQQQGAVPTQLVWVSEPLNSFYRRKIHLLAASFGLEHRTLAESTVRKGTNELRPRNCLTCGGPCTEGRRHGTGTSEWKAIEVAVNGSSRKASGPQ